MRNFFISLILLGVFIFGTGTKAFWFSERQLDFSGEKIITIKDNGYTHLSVKTSAKTLENLMEEQNIRLNEPDVIFPPLETKLYSGMIIHIQRATPIKILVDGGMIEKKVLAQKIGEALTEAGVKLNHLDKINFEEDSPVVAGAKIEVTRIEVEEVMEKEKIEFKTIEKKDNKVLWRKKKVTQKGEEGTREVKYKITYKDGKQISKKKLATEIIKKPKNEIVSIGTKVKIGKSKTGIASWYAYTGTMACASRMFPRGTWLRVTNQENGKQIFVVVNDYGPQRGTGKIIDLDKVAFQKLASIGQGVVKVKVEEIKD